MNLAAILNDVDGNTSAAMQASNPVFVTIDPPPEATYDSEDLAIAAIHCWTKDHDFNMLKRRVLYTGTHPRTVWKRGFDRDHAGKP
ncbi:hypothetical protein P3T76_000943 [Phytophthora citrophthora]|uniref:Uncharacterized protein n=1 Tax=Phytophthora citrophthora TaxID=4793 RepID=A0AAD9GZ57_9STRA|nr:hypothetical protein P3T76_000943 [Phytophthora citrophthora]